MITEESESEVFTSDDDDYEVSMDVSSSEKEEIFSDNETDNYEPTPPKNRRKSAPYLKRNNSNTNQNILRRKSTIHVSSNKENDYLKVFKNKFNKKLFQTMKFKADENQKKSFYGMLNKGNSHDLSFGASGNLMFNDSSQPDQSTSGVNFFMLFSV